MDRLGKRMPGSILVVSAFAKVNFTLDVLSRRPDGYHNIASVMQTISLADRIEISLRPDCGVFLECDDSSAPQAEQNLAYRAAEALLAYSRRDQGVHIKLQKWIPAQAGLGGGSSDAAGVLRGLNALLNLSLDAHTLARIGAELGSDVPFFLHGGTASCRGKGDQVTELPDPPALWFVIVKPTESISTARAYEALDRIPERVSSRSTRAMEVLVRSGDRERAAARMTNDFEQAIFSEETAIALLHDEFMMARARNARMCGSGSAVFGVAFSEPEAEEIARIMKLKYRDVHVCRSISRAEAGELKAFHP